MSKILDLIDNFVLGAALIFFLAANLRLAIDYYFASYKKFLTELAKEQLREPRVSGNLGIH